VSFTGPLGTTRPVEPAAIGPGVEAFKRRTVSMRSKSPHKRVTLSDVSKAAGVSLMTVSNVASGKGHLVRRETREHVQTAIARLRYRPNLSARSLRLSQTFSVGIVIADSDPAFLNDPFISRLVSGVSNYLSALDYTLDVQGVAPERFENATILKRIRNDAFCAVLCGPQPLRKRHFGYLQHLEQPVVVFQEVFRSTAANISLVRQDDFGGGQTIGKHLQQRNVRRVAFIRPRLDWSAVEQREKGLRLALEGTRSPAQVSTYVAASESFEDVCVVTEQLLQANVPDAIVAATDSMAVAALKTCEHRGVRVPRDILLVGFNGFDAWRYTTPTLTTVTSPAYDMGQFAGELLIKRLRGKKFDTRNRVFTVAFQPGEST
jgi:LacI family transcriptional regulator, galactose operon repressor